MRLFQWLPVKAKLAIAILGTTSVSLVIACGMFVIYELRTFRQTMIARVTVLADVLALSSTAALEFEEPDRANEILNGMAAAPSILAAGLYTRQGNPFARYSRNAQLVEAPDRPGREGSSFDKNHLTLFRPVRRDGQEIGSIGLVVSLVELEDRLSSYAMISSLVLAGCLGFALALAYVLQRMISKPILSLASTAALVSERKDYSVRAVKQTEDELGRLADSFNQMLAGIEERDTTLVETNKVLRFQVEARIEAEREFKTLNEELERRVQDRTRELQRSNSELEQFAYIASHDLQEPLRMVVSYLQLIERRYKDRLDADGVQFLKFAVDGGLRMQTLILDLLAFSRVGNRSKPLEPVDLNKLLASVRANLKVAILETGTTITQDALPTVHGDPTQLSQLLQNLINNGIKFRGKAPPRIDILAARGGHEWRFGVRDNGIGIEPQYFDRIFAIFQRLHSSNEYPGTGIGLALCKRIVERHGGRIWVESAPGKGSTFYFTIADFISDGI